MYAPLPPQERIALGLDARLRAAVEADYQPLTPEDLENSYFSEFDRSILLDARKTEQHKQRQLRFMAEARQTLLEQPYVEEEQIYEHVLHTLDPSARPPRVILGQLVGARTLSFEDHGARIYPMFQFKDEDGFVPHSVVATVNLLQGRAADEQTTFSDVYWWQCTDNQQYIGNGVPYAEISARQLLATPELHLAIVERATRQTLR